MICGIYILDAQAVDLIYGPAERADIARLVALEPTPQTRQTIVQNPALLANVEVIFGGWGAPVMDAAFLRAAPKLQMMFYGAGSVRGVVTEASWQRGVRITSAYAANAVPVSEYTLAAILFSLKHGWRFAAVVHRDGKYPPHTPGPGAYETTVGLVSLGMIGRLVRERLRPFDLRVIAYDPFISPAEATKLNVELVALDELFQQADVVSLHTPWLPETVGMIAGAHFAAMKPGATFINTARGAVVREPEMIEVLQRRPDLQAVLDVTCPEPPAAGSPLYTLPNVVLTPHIAGSMGNECRRMGRYMVEELQRYLAGQPLRWEITKEQAAILA